MTEIKTAQAFGSIADDGELYGVAGIEIDTERDLYYGDIMVPIVIVHGLIEPEIHEAAALLVKSREVCEWKYEAGVWGCLTKCTSTLFYGDGPDFCPSCGRRVKVV